MSIINVTRSSMPPMEEFVAEIGDIWDSHWLTNMGAKHRRLEAELKAYLGVPNVTLFSNGHLALEHLLAALDLPKGSEVITTPFTFASTTHAIVRNGLVPVFCDIDPVDYTLDAGRLERLITARTSAVLPVHVYGNLCDVDAIGEIAARRGLRVVYDAAHAFGVTRNGEGVAGFGDASMFSFHATKVFNTIEGGAACYRDGALGPVLDDLKNFGIHGPEEVLRVGGNAKMSEFQAAMGLCNLRHLDEELGKRRVAAERYRERLDGVRGIRLTVPRDGVRPNDAYFPVVFDGYGYGRDEVFERLKAEGIVARKYFYPLTSDFACYRGVLDPGDTPVARRVAANVLTLPLYAGLSVRDVDRICDIVLGEQVDS